MTIAVSVQRTPASLRASWSISHALRAHTQIPPISSAPARKDNLWQSTCAEMFWAAEGPQYYEANLSPSGDYQIYHFEAERFGRAPAALSPSHWFREDTPEGLRLSCEIGLPPQFQTVPIKIGMSCVLLGLDHTCTYWALSHADPHRPDFHDPRAWTITLEPQHRVPIYTHLLASVSG